jgi:septal ring factor EnvC (AmiA/AmiB activator)
MNLSDDKQSPLGRNAGAVPVWGPACAAPAHPHYEVGAVGFGPAWDDEEDTVQLTWHGWKRVSDSMAASIVRLEQENEELRATEAMLQEQARILAKERDEAREAFTIATANCTEAQQRLRDMEDQRDCAMDVIQRLERKIAESAMLEADRLRPRQGASLYDIAESVREKYDPEYEREGIEN